MIKVNIKGNEVRPESSYDQLFHGPKGEIRDGIYRCWLTEEDVDLLFKSDAPLVKPFLTRGEGDMEGHYLIYNTSSYSISSEIRRAVINDHNFGDLELSELPFIRARISTLLNDDQSESEPTNALLSRAIFEVFLPENHTDKQTLQKLQKLYFDVYLPLNRLETIEMYFSEKSNELKAFAKRLDERTEQARLVGVDHRLSQLPPRPSPKHAWYPGSKKWLYNEYYGVEKSIYAYKGVNGW